MKIMSIAIAAVLLTNQLACAQSGSNTRVGGRCEGCEAMYENKQPFEKLSNELILPDYNSPGPKLEIRGTVYKAGTKSPAPGVILYLYHTDQKGVYPTKGNETGWEKRHGYIRGWLKTNEKGEYVIRTLRPASYPEGRFAAHIHCVIKEPELNEYYISDFLFDDDPYLEKGRNYDNAPGGNGVLKTVEKSGVLTASRDIYLGKSVRDYPYTQ